MPTFMKDYLRRAWDAHGRIPSTLRASSAPIVRKATGVTSLELHATADIQKKEDRTALSYEKFAEGWTSIAAITSRCLEDILSTEQGRDQWLLNEIGDPGGHSRIGDHETLQRLLRSGARFQHLPVVSDFVPLSLAAEEARNAGYETSVATPAFEARLNKVAFAAATNIALRTRPDIVHLSSNFRVPDPLTEVKVAFFFDQVWLTRGHGGSTLRVVALQIDASEDISEDVEQRDRKLRAMGYEVFHVGGWWILIDPQRVIYEFMQAAEIFVVRQRPLAYPGPSIDDYRCQSSACPHPMVRDEQGYGITQHKGLSIHEECLDRVVNEDEFGWVEYRDL